MKKRLISLLLYLCMAITLLSATMLTASALDDPKEAAGKPKLLSNGKYFVCNGADVRIEAANDLTPEGAFASKVYYRYGDMKNYAYLGQFNLLNVDVYGGSEMEWYAPGWGIRYQSNITMTGGFVKNIFGGGVAAKIAGDVNITMTGGRVIGSIYGCGGSKGATEFGASSVDGDVNIRVTGGFVGYETSGFGTDGNICGYSPYGGYRSKTKIYVSKDVNLDGKVYGTRPGAAAREDCIGEVYAKNKAAEESFVHLGWRTDKGHSYKGTLSTDAVVTTGTSDGLTILDGANITMSRFYNNYGSLHVGKNATLTINNSNQTSDFLTSGTMQVAEGGTLVFQGKPIKNEGSIELGKNAKLEVNTRLTNTSRIDLGQGDMIGSGSLTNSGTITYHVRDEDIAPIAPVDFSGSAMTPAISLNPRRVLGLTLTTEPLDSYTVSYTNNINAGTATATLTHKDKPDITASKTFEIKRVEVQLADVSASFYEDAEQAYSYFDGYVTVRVKPKRTNQEGTEVPLSKDDLPKITLAVTSENGALTKDVDATRVAVDNGYYTCRFYTKDLYPHQRSQIRVKVGATNNIEAFEGDLDKPVFRYDFDYYPAASEYSTDLKVGESKVILDAGDTQGTTKVSCADGHILTYRGATSLDMSQQAVSGKSVKNLAFQLLMRGGAVENIYAGGGSGSVVNENTFQVTVEGGAVDTLHAVPTNGQAIAKRVEVRVTGGTVNTICGGTVDSVCGGGNRTIWEGTTIDSYIAVLGGTVKRVSAMGATGESTGIFPLTTISIDKPDSFTNLLYFNGDYYVLKNNVTILDDVTIPAGTLSTDKASKLTVPAGKTLTVHGKAYGGGTLDVLPGGHVALTPSLAMLDRDSFLTGDANPVPEVTVKLLSKTFTQGVDYTVTLAKPAGAGVGTVTVTPKEGGALSGEPVELSYSVSAQEGSVTLKGYYESPYASVGQPIPEPTAQQIEKLGSGAVSFTWYRGTLTEQELASSLPISFVPSQMGSYTLHVKVAGDATYTAASTIAHVTIVVPEDTAVATLEGEQLDKTSGWYTGAVKLIAPENYKISYKNNTNDWADFLTIDREMNEDVTYYLKHTKGYVTTAKTIRVRIDKTDPKFSITFSDYELLSFRFTLASEVVDTAEIVEYKYLTRYGPQAEWDDARTVTKELVQKEGKLITSTTGEVADGIPGCYMTVCLAVKDASGRTFFTKVKDKKEWLPMLRSEGVIVVNKNPHYPYDGTVIQPPPNSLSVLYLGTELPRNFFTEGGPATEKLPGNYKLFVGEELNVVNEYWGTYLTYTIDKIPMKDATITLSQDAYTYDGTECYPTVTVTDTHNGTTLTENPKNYTVTYTNNLHVGEATVTVTMKESAQYFAAGERKVTFHINQAQPTISLTALETPYTGERITKLPEENVSVAGFPYDQIKFDFYESETAKTTLTEFPKDAGIYWVGVDMAATDDCTAIKHERVKLEITKLRVETQAMPRFDYSEVPVQIDLTHFLQTALLPGDEAKGIVEKVTFSYDQGFTFDTATNVLTYPGPAKQTVDCPMECHAKNYVIACRPKLDWEQYRTVLGLNQLIATIPAEVPYTGETPALGEAIQGFTPGEKGSFAYEYAQPTKTGWQSMYPDRPINPGRYRVLIRYSDNTHYGELMRYFNIVEADSVITLASDKDALTYGESFTLTATVKRAAEVSTFTLGDNKVDFYCGETLLGSVAVTPDADGTETATLTYDTAVTEILPPGTNTMHAVYNGKNGWNGSKSGEVTVTLNPKTVRLKYSSNTLTPQTYKAGKSVITFTNGNEFRNLVTEDILTYDEYKVKLYQHSNQGSFGTPDVGTKKPISFIDYKLDGSQKEYYTLVLPTNVTIDITPQILSQEEPNAVFIKVPDQTYTGEALTPEVSVWDGITELKEGRDYTVTDYRDNTVGGTGTAVVTFAGNYQGTLEKTFPIRKGTSTVAPLVVKNGEGTETTAFTYGDTITVEFTPTLVSTFALPAETVNQAALYRGNTQLTEPVVAGTNGRFTLTYNTADAADPTKPGLKLGNNDLTVRFGGDGNLDKSSTGVTVTLSARPLTGSVAGMTKTYDGTGSFLGKTVTLTGKLGSDDADHAIVDFTVDDANVGEGKAVSLTKIEVTGDHAGWYAVPTKLEGKVSITKADYGSAIPDNAASVYWNNNGVKNHRLTGVPASAGLISGYSVGTVSGTDPKIIASATCEKGIVSLTLASGLQNTDVGKSAIVPVTVSCQNYNDFVVNVVATLTSKTDVSGSITFPDGEQTYTGSPLTYETAKMEGYNAKLIVYTYAANSADASLQDDKPLTVGTYTVTATYEDDDNFGSQSATFTVKKAASTVTPTPDTNEYTYGDIIPLKATVTIATFASTNKVEFFANGKSIGSEAVVDGTATLNYDTKAKGLTIGENEITAVYGGSENLDLNASKTNKITVTLKAKQLTGTVEPGVEKVYDGTAAFGGAITLDGVHSGDDVTALANFFVADKNVGTEKPISRIARMELTGAAAEWYIQPQTLGGTVKIISRPVTVTGATVRDKIYDMSPDTEVLSITLDGLVGGESLSVADGDLTASAAFRDANAGKNKPVDVTEIALVSTAARNYALNGTTFVATGTITPADFTATVTIAVTSDVNVAGKLDAGDELTATVSGLQDVLRYQWKINDEPVGTDSTYTMEAGKMGVVTCTVTSDGNVVGEQTSAGLEIGKITLEGSISISGSTTLGSDLTLDVSGLTPSDATYDILWSGGSTADTYKITADTLGKKISVTITGNGDFTGSKAAELDIPAVAPDAPVITAVAGDGKVTVSWEAPFNGGSAITGYTLTVNGGAPISVAAAATSYEVTGLTNGDEYTFVLTAINGVGNAASDAVTVIPTGIRTVTFETNGGNTIDPMQVANGSTITLPTPYKSGYDFAGWYTDAAMTAAFDPAAPIVSDMTLFAKWTERVNDGGDRDDNRASVSFNEGGTAKAYNNGTVTITPDKGYQIAKITVDGIETAIPENGRLTGLTSRNEVEITFEKIPAEKPAETTPVSEVFGDILANAWYTESVQFVVDRNLFSGTSATTFSPEATTTRATLWTVLYRLSGATVKGEGKAWYADAQAWAKEIGLSDGTNPEGEITREQLAVLLWRYAGSPMLMDYPGLSGFDDVSELSDWAQAALAWAHQQGIIGGKNGNTLDPKGNASRAEVAMMLMRFVKNSEK